MVQLVLTDSIQPVTPEVRNPVQKPESEQKAPSSFDELVAAHTAGPEEDAGAEQPVTKETPPDTAPSVLAGAQAEEKKPPELHDRPYGEKKLTKKTPAGEKPSDEEKPVAQKAEAEKKEKTAEDGSKRLQKKRLDAEFARYEQVAAPADGEQDSHLAEVAAATASPGTPSVRKELAPGENEAEIPAGESLPFTEETIVPPGMKADPSGQEFASQDFGASQEKKSAFSEKKQLAFDSAGKITVEDLRTQAEKPAAPEKKSLLKPELRQTSENSAVMTLDLAQDAAETDVLSLNAQAASSDGSTFRAMLSSQIAANTPEFVKAGNIVLKDNNRGTINLVLHPDDLGNVKINLSLDGKSISGHITVATKEALEVFKDNAETLREAFIKSGFENASFDISYGNSGNNSSAQDFQGWQGGNGLMARHFYGGEAAGTEVFVAESADFSEYSVNIVA